MNATRYDIECSEGGVGMLPSKWGEWVSYTEYKDEITNLNIEIAGARGNVSDLEFYLSQADARIAELEAQVRALQDRAPEEW